MLKPEIVARDPDLIKDILITNFNSFRDNDSKLSKRFDSLLAVDPFFTRDEEWKEGRKQITPIFSSSKVGFQNINVDQCKVQYIYKLSNLA